MKFAGSVMLGDLNDFIEPAQACVNPLFASDEPAAGQDKGVAKISLDSGIFSGLEYVGVAGTSSLVCDTAVRAAVVACLSVRTDTRSHAACSAPAEDPGLMRPTKRKTAKITLSDCLACR